MKQPKGKIDVQIAEQFLSDHVDSFEKKDQANERGLCGHVDTSSRGVKEWAWDPYNPGGAGQGSRQRNGSQDDFCGACWASLRGGLSGRALPGAPSRVHVATAAITRHE